MISRSRAALLWVASVLVVVVAPLTATAAPSSPSAPRGLDDLGRLRADSPVAVHVDRDSDGSVALVRSSRGRAAGRASRAGCRSAGDCEVVPRSVRRGAGPRRQTSVAGTLHTHRSIDGGHVARANQEVAGVPVFAGEVVLSLDDKDRLLSIGGETTEATTVPVPVVSEARARRTAVAVTAAAHRTSLLPSDRDRRGSVAVRPAVGRRAHGRGRPARLALRGHRTWCARPRAGGNRPRRCRAQGRRGHRTDRRVCDGATRW
jgi:hypothetical protein